MNIVRNTFLLIFYLYSIFVIFTRANNEDHEDALL